MLVNMISYLGKIIYLQKVFGKKVCGRNLLCCSVTRYSCIYNYLLCEIPIFSIRLLCFLDYKRGCSVAKGSHVKSVHSVNQENSLKNVFLNCTVVSHSHGILNKFLLIVVKFGCLGCWNCSLILRFLPNRILNVPFGLDLILNDLMLLLNCLKRTVCWVMNDIEEKFLIKFLWKELELGKVASCSRSRIVNFWTAGFQKLCIQD